MDKRQIERIDLKEIGLTWGFPGVVICAISLLVALKLGNSFGQNGFVMGVTFILCTILLALIYWQLFQVLPQDIYVLCTHKKMKSKNGQETNTIGEVCEEVEEYEELLPIETIEPLNVSVESVQPMPKKNMAAISLTTTQPETPQSIYNRCKSAHHEQQTRQREEMLQCINTYILEAMSPFCDMESINTIQKNMMGWADDKNHEPSPVYVSKDLTTLDLRHFVWNIAERLQFFGMDYSCTQRGLFVKRMFPDICRNAEADYLAKNLTHKRNEGFIKLDKPDKNSFLFHNKM